MGKYPKARVVPFSSVVGSSVTLHDPETGRVIGQLAILNTGGKQMEDWKQRQIAVAEDTAKRINCHDDLVKVLHELRNECSGTPRPNRLVALIKQADEVLLRAHAK